MSDVSEIMREFDAILASNKKSLVAMSIEDIRAFKALKARLLIDLLTEEILSKHNLMCLDIPEFEQKKKRSQLGEAECRDGTTRVAGPPQAHFCFVKLVLWN